MKRHLQEPGVRKWSGNDLLELQGEGLTVMDSFFSQYGNCAVCGCNVSADTITAGLVSIDGKVMPFDGTTGIEVFPVYLIAEVEHVQRDYADDVVRDIALRYSAKMVQEKPAVSCIEIQENSVPMFFDGMQSVWKNNMLNQLKELGETDADLKKSIETLQKTDETTGHSVTALEKRMPSSIDHAPGINDDGYSIGVEVYQTLSDGSKVFWKCHDNTKGAAVWKRSGEGSGGGSYGGAVYLTGQTNFSKASIIIKEGVLS